MLTYLIRQLPWLAAVILAATVSTAQERECGDRPPAPPSHATPPPRVSASESTYCPLPPLPITPQRRTETKTPPAPPVILARLKHGVKVERKWGTGFLEDWSRKPQSVSSLLARFGSEQGNRYDYADLSADDFSFDPNEIPILYLTGHREAALPKTTVHKIAAYVNTGGFVLCEACCGDAHRMAWYRRLVEEIFPGRELYRLSPDHPLFRCGSNLTSVRYRVDGRESSGPPTMWGIDFGCRTAVVVSEFDLSAGWTHEDYEYSQEFGQRYAEEDAAKMGLNIVRYALATFELGRQYPQAAVLVEPATKSNSEFRIAHLKHSGQWNTNPSALSLLLDEVERTTSLSVSFGKYDLAILKLNAQDFPFAFLTGHHDLALTDAERESLHTYLKSGGFLLAESCCGRIAFDRSFRELVPALTGTELQPLPASHPLFTQFHNVSEVTFASPEVPQGGPQLEAAYVDNKLAVLYSAQGLSCGWQGKTCPFCRGYSAGDSVRLGVNIIMYSMMH